MINLYSSGIKGSMLSPQLSPCLCRQLEKNEASKENVRTTNIVLSANSNANLDDRTPAKGASFGNIGRGPFTKNFVIPKEAEKRERIMVMTDNDNSFVLPPCKGSLG